MSLSDTTYADVSSGRQLINHSPTKISENEKPRKLENHKQKCVPERKRRKKLDLVKRTCFVDWVYCDWNEREERRRCDVYTYFFPNK